MAEERNEEEMLPSAIFAAARAEFLAWGFEGANIDRMAKAARVSKSRIYEVAPDKEALFERVVRGVLQRIARGELPPLAGPPEEVLPVLGRWVVAANNVSDNLGLTRITIALAESLPALSAEIGTQRRTLLKPAHFWLESLRREGVLTFADAETAFARFCLMATGGFAPFFDVAPRPGEVEAATRAFLWGHVARPRDGALQLRAPVVLEGIAFAPEVLTGRRARQTRLPPERYAGLLEEAARAFLVHGYRRASMAEIVQRTGVAKTTIYRQFGAKVGLFSASLQHLLAGERERLPLGQEVEASLAAAADMLSARFRAPRQLALLRLLVAEMPQFPALCQPVYRELWRPEMLQLENWFAALAREGLLAPDLLPFAAAHFFILAVDGFVHLTGQPRPPSPGEEVAEMFLYGVRK